MLRQFKVFRHEPALSVVLLSARLGPSLKRPLHDPGQHLFQEMVSQSGVREELGQVAGMTDPEPQVRPIRVFSELGFEARANFLQGDLEVGPEGDGGGLDINSSHRFGEFAASLRVGRVVRQRFEDSFNDRAQAGALGDPDDVEAIAFRRPLELGIQPSDHVRFADTRGSGDRKEQETRWHIVGEEGLEERLL